MKLLPDIFDKDARKEFRRFLKSTGETSWQQKIAKLNALPFFPPPSPNAYLNYLASRNPLTRHIEKYLTLEAEGKTLRRRATPEFMKACGYLKVINPLFHQSESSVIPKLKSNIV